MTTHDQHPASSTLDEISRESRTALATLRGYVEIVQEELSERGIAMDDEFDHLSGALGDLLCSIARLEEHATRVGLEANVDVLTSLPNRRHLFDVGERWVREPGRLSAILLDLDDFKWVNDRYGHHAGDAVLVEFARRLRVTLRTGDLVCRLAGDEFVVLLPNADAKVVEQIALRILQSVESETFVIDDSLSLPLGASLGIAERSPEHNNLEDLLRAADHAMYAEKRLRYDRRSVRRLRDALDS